MYSCLQVFLTLTLMPPEGQGWSYLYLPVLGSSNEDPLIFKLLRESHSSLEHSVTSDLSWTTYLRSTCACLSFYLDLPESYLPGSLSSATASSLSAEPALCPVTLYHLTSQQPISTQSWKSLPAHSRVSTSHWKYFF